MTLKLLRSLFLAGTTALTLAPVAPMTATAAEMTEQEREDFRSEVRDYLLEHPEVIFEAVQAYKDQQEQNAAASDKTLVSQNQKAIFDDGFSWSGGNPDGDITLVEFMDYRCGYCRRAFQDVEKLIATDGNIRFVLKEFPILGPDSVTASRFAIATRLIAGNDAYKSVHDALMNFDGPYDDTGLGRLADGLGLDAQPILAAMETDPVNAEITANHKLAQVLNVSGTPTFVLPGTMLRGYLPLDGMRQVVADIRTE
ncbi:DsbA family protein [Pseudooceanicola sp. CBS1P-1]|uniref:Thioredoxin domain-containing protein n=1 Tax=Pseudooceanicola albus TaxID=2692189 RepID=A0A6L7G2Z0_9RHOB|nr:MULTISPECIES: DsbA family protein [Pseudooceanicola]MBT9382412.1 DsbA family protein [Pseudooceanicola endophyticus]MXN16953.1 thioredoxin domain-containing protein [Pseudooceanicola albus]